MSTKQPAFESVAGPATPRRRRVQENQRQRLLDAAIGILLGEGMAKFTSTRIAELAGLHKPAFYAHFKNVDECLQAVALQVAKAKVRETLVGHTLMLEQLPISFDDAHITRSIAHSQRLIAQLLLAVRKHEPLYKLLRRYHADEGALGKAIRDIDGYVLERWVEYFWRLAVHFGVDARHFKEVSQMAEHVVAMSYIAIGRVLDGRASDLEAEAGRVARYGFAVVGFEFRRMIALGSEP
jgi:AcrR family transcriptional regulator